MALCAGAALLVGNVFGGSLDSIDRVYTALWFGFEASVPVLAGVAFRRRAYPVGIGTLAMLVSAISLLVLASSPSALHVPLLIVVLGVPGGVFGWALAGRLPDGPDSKSTL